MPSTLTRRPVPALVALAALLVLTALVWWRVLNRDDSSGASEGTSCPTPSPSPTTSATEKVLPAPSTITLTVLNSTNRTGIAGKARTTFLQDGFRVPAPAGNDLKYQGKIPGVAEIRYGPSGKQAASVVAYYLPGAKLVPTSSSTATVVVSLGAKYRSIASQAAVTSALRAAGARLGPPPATPTSSGTASPSC